MGRQATPEETQGVKRERESEETSQAARATKDDGHATEQGFGDEPNPKRPMLDPQSRPEKVVEEGRIFFYYRPRVGVEEPHSISEIQRLFIVLSPTSREDAPNRMLIVAKKRLPDAKRKEKFYGFVEAVNASMEALTSGLGPSEYNTKTRGRRRVEAARVVGEGAYTIVDDGGRDTYLAYKLEVPEEPGDVQKELRITPQARFHLSIKNPTVPNPPNASIGAGKKVDYPPEKMKEFEGPPGGYNWISAKDTGLLDTQGCEILLIAAGTDDLEDRLGGEVEKRLEKAVEAEQEEADDDPEKMLELLKAEIRADVGDIVTEPVETGKWA
eukprot:jgi/Botrbrau1/19544/Bobra.0035s0036.1